MQESVSLCDEKHPQTADKINEHSCYCYILILFLKANQLLFDCACVLSSHYTSGKSVIHGLRSNLKL